MSRRLIIALFCLTIPSMAAAQEMPAPKIRPGQHVFVITASGQEVEGEVDRITDGDIVIDTESGLRTHALSTLLRIEKPDSVWNGAIYGAGTAVGIVVLGLTVFHNDPCVPSGNVGPAAITCPVEPGTSSGEIMWGMTRLVAIGAAVGALFDAIHPGRDVVWRNDGRLTLRIAPTATLHSVGLSGKVRW